MNFLTKVTMAILCTLFIACSTHELDNETYDKQLFSRSSDPISVSYTNLDGTAVTSTCTKIEVDYSTTNIALFTLTKSDGTQSVNSASNAVASVATGYELELTVDGTNTVSAADLSTTICETNLCYSNAEGTIIGTGLDFIIDEIPEGM